MRLFPHRQLRPERALTHPAWLGALALLVVNDHLLKGAGLLPAWMTGKLSDFAGLLVAPLLLATLCRARSWRGLWMAHAAVGLGFALINLSPAVADAVESASLSTPFPWQIAVDPTDLVALPALLLSLRVFATVAAQPLELRGALHTAVQCTGVIAGSLACMATSPVPPECEEGPCLEQPLPTEFGSLSIGNDTDVERLVRVRPLKPSVSIDCTDDVVDPAALMSRKLFAPAETWLLQPGRALTLDASGCTFYLVDADGLPMTLLFWFEGDYPSTELPTSTEAISDRMIRMSEVVEGRLMFAPHPAIADAPPLEDAAGEEECEVPDETIGLSWSTPPVGNRVIDAIESAPDGCHLLSIETSKFALCLPPGAMPFEPGEEVNISEFGTAGGEELRIGGASATLTALRGFSPLPQSATDFTAAAEQVRGCEVQHDACGNAVFPVAIEVQGPAGESTRLEAGGAGLFGTDASHSFYLVRAQRTPAVDTECSPFDPFQTYFESVLISMHGE